MFNVKESGDWVNVFGDLGDWWIGNNISNLIEMELDSKYKRVNVKWENESIDDYFCLINI